MDNADHTSPHLRFHEHVKNAMIGTNDGACGLPVVHDYITQASSRFAFKKVRLKPVGRTVNHNRFHPSLIGRSQVEDLRVPVAKCSPVDDKAVVDLWLRTPNQL